MAKGSEAARLTELLPGLASAIGCDRLSIETQLSNAATGSRWLLAGEGSRFVATLDTPLAAAIGIDREFQFRLLAQLKYLAIAPAPVVCDRDAGVTVVSYVAGQNPGVHFASDVKQLDSLAMVLRKLHATDATFAGDFPHTQFVARIDGYARLADSQTADALRAQVVDRIATQRNSTTALCHNDAHAGNILLSDGLRLIDWDYAGEGPVWFDLASAIAGLALNDRASHRLLDAYFGPEIVWTSAELADWLIVREQVERLWQLCVASQIRKT